MPSKRLPFDVDSDTTVETVDLSTGVVSLKGTTLSGKGYEISGDVEEVNIVVSRDDSYSRFYSDKYTPVKEESEYWLKFKIKDDTDTGSYAYKVQLETVDVERTARVEASDRTTKAVNAARVLAGVPEDAKFRFDYRYDGDLRGLDEPQPVDVQFVWTEKVVK